MKRLTKLLSVAVLAFTLFSCSDDEKKQGTIAEVAQRSPNLSILVDALVKTGLAETFDSPGAYTVFAPTNDRFEAFLAANGFASLDDVPVPVLTEVLKNHVLAGEFYSSDISTGYVKTLAVGGASNSNPLSMYINVTDDGVIINGGNTNGGGTVTAYDIKASNGVIHVVDGVLGLPTVVNHAIANPAFSTLVAALTFNPSSGFAGTLSGTAASPFTVFAPTNDAFGAFLAETGFSGLGAIPANVLESTLKYHVVTGANVLSTSLTNGQSVSTFAGQNFTINISGTSASITDANNRVSGITATDVQCSNGVIHVINKVLLPSLN